MPLRLRLNILYIHRIKIKSKLVRIQEETVTCMNVRLCYHNRDEGLLCTQNRPSWDPNCPPREPMNSTNTSSLALSVAVFVLTSESELSGCESTYRTYLCKCCRMPMRKTYSNKVNFRSQDTE